MRIDQTKPIPAHAHPTVRFILEEARRQGMPRRQLAIRAGYDDALIGQIQRAEAGLPVRTLEALLGALGYELVIAKQGEKR